jgi:hypothetical protein
MRLKRLAERFGSHRYGWSLPCRESGAGPGRRIHHSRPVERQAGRRTRPCSLDNRECIVKLSDFRGRDRRRGHFTSRRCCRVVGRTGPHPDDTRPVPPRPPTLVRTWMVGSGPGRDPDTGMADTLGHHRDRGYGATAASLQLEAAPVRAMQTASPHSHRTPPAQA